MIYWINIHEEAKGDDICHVWSKDDTFYCLCKCISIDLLGLVY
jgi:hypothetical protein